MSVRARSRPERRRLLPPVTGSEKILEHDQLRIDARVDDRKHFDALSETATLAEISRSLSQRHGPWSTRLHLIAMVMCEKNTMDVPGRDGSGGARLPRA